MPDEATGLRLRELQASTAEAFAWELNSCYHDQAAGTVQHGVTRNDIAHAFAIAEYRKLLHWALLHDELRRQWGTPATPEAAKRLSIPPWQQQLVAGERPKVPGNPEREPGAIGDFPDLTSTWQNALAQFLVGRRHLLASQRGPDREQWGPQQRTFAEMSQPPEREPGDDDDDDEPSSHESSPPA